MITAIIVAITPFIVNAITGFIKMLPAIAELRGSRNLVIRTLVALVSLVYVIFALWLEPGSVSENALETAVTALILAFLAWLSSLGSYEAFFKQK